MAQPSGPIQVIPPGLLGLLNLKNMGRLPDVLINEVQPGIDLQEWWLRANLINQPAPSTDSLVAGSYNSFRSFTAGAGAIQVPDREWWFVEWYTASFTAAGAGNSATSIDLALEFQQAGVSRWTPLGCVEPAQAILNNARWQLVAKSFWVPPGSELGFCVSSVATAVLDVATLTLRYTPCPI